MQRQVSPPQQAQPVAPTTQPAQPAGNRWLGPLAGIAAGLGLGWLFAQGAGGMIGALLLALLVGSGVVILIRTFSRQRNEPARQMQFTGLGSLITPPTAGDGAQTTAGSLPQLSPEPQIPAGFDTETFLKQAKRNFVRLQEANDRADLAELREVTTSEMFESLKSDVIARGARQQQTEIITLNASPLEVVTEGGMHWASVCFSGSLRESPQAASVAFEEVWNLQKPVSGETGWLLAGIQQVA